MTTDELKKMMDPLKANPALMQRFALETLADLRNGDVMLVDPTNPFIFAIEVGTASACIAVDAIEAGIRKRFLPLAQSFDDLYGWISDYGVQDIFSMPGKGTIATFLNVDEVRARAITVPNAGYRKLTIPRNTTIKADSLHFGLLYPIDILVYDNDTIQAVYDTSQPTPQQVISSNVVDTVLTTDGKMDLLQITVPMMQFRLESHRETYAEYRYFKRTLPLKDPYYYCRVYHAGNDNKWVEMKVVLTGFVYDANHVTAVITPKEGSIDVAIPLIYSSKGMVKPNIRIDIYTTMGAVQGVNLAEVAPTDFGADWLDYADPSNTYVKAFVDLPTKMVWGLSALTGGRAPMSFEAVKQQLTNDALGADSAVSEEQLQQKLYDDGFLLVKDIDDTTNRIYLAVKGLPEVPDYHIKSSISNAIRNITSTINKLLLSPTIIDNGLRTTILSNTQFNWNGGTIYPLDQAQLDYIASLPPEELVEYLNLQSIVYTPLYYVLDTSNNLFGVRVYGLDHPTINAIVFKEANATTGIEAYLNGYILEKTKTGYSLFIQVKGGETYANVAPADLGFRVAIPIEGGRMMRDAVLQGMDEKERIYVWRVDIDTNHDIDANNQLDINNFSINNTLAPHVFIPLDSTIEVYPLCKVRAPNYVPSMGDSNLGFYDDTFPMVLMYSELKVSFGEDMNQIWHGNRTYVTAAEYMTATIPIQAVYERDVIEKDPLTGAFKVYDDGQGGTTLNIIHHQGDLVFDETGQPVWKYLPGQVILSNGQPVVKVARELERTFGVMLIDGRLLYCTEPKDVSYRDEVSLGLSGYLTNTIIPISENALEKTNIYYFPERLIGDVMASVDGEPAQALSPNLSFVVRFFLNKEDFKSDYMRSQCELIVTDAIIAELDNRTISISSLVDRVANAMGENVKVYDIQFGGHLAGATTVTLLDVADNFSLIHLNNINDENYITLKEDIAIEFKELTA